VNAPTIIIYYINLFILFNNTMKTKTTTIFEKSFPTITEAISYDSLISIFLESKSKAIPHARNLVVQARARHPADPDSALDCLLAYCDTQNIDQHRLLELQDIALLQLDEDDVESNILIEAAMAVASLDFKLPKPLAESSREFRLKEAPTCPFPRHRFSHQNGKYAPGPLPEHVFRFLRYSRHAEVTLQRVITQQTGIRPDDITSAFAFPTVRSSTDYRNYIFIKEALRITNSLNSIYNEISEFLDQEDTFVFSCRDRDQTLVRIVRHTRLLSPRQRKALRSGHLMSLRQIPKSIGSSFMVFRFQRDSSNKLYLFQTSIVISPHGLRAKETKTFINLKHLEQINVLNKLKSLLYSRFPDVAFRKISNRHSFDAGNIGYTSE